MDIGERLKTLRIAHHLTQAQVAQRLWVSKAVISGYELSTRSPSYPNLIKLAALYGVTTDYLLGVDSRQLLDVSGLSDEQIRLVGEVVRQLRATQKS